jgi:cell division protein FtsL
MPALQIAALIVALLVTSGATLFFIRYGTRLAFAERDSAEARNKTAEHDREIAATKARVQLMEQTLNQIRDSLSKLNVIDEIKATCDQLKERAAEDRRATSDLRTEIRELLKR